MKFRIEIVQDVASGKWRWELYDTDVAQHPSAVSEPVFLTADQAEAELRKMLVRLPPL